MIDIKNQEILHDVSSTGRVRPWRKLKISNELLSVAYLSVNPDKAVRLSDCATMLAYRITPEGHKILKSANFCRVRLCPICQWRRALKTYSHMLRIVSEIEKEYPRGYIFLTLTMKNCAPEELNENLNRLLSAVRRLMLFKRVKSSVKGWFRGVEITHNKADGTLHPHIHMLLCVNKRYFKSKEYIQQAEWTELWRQALNVDYKPIVDVRRVKGGNPRAIVECSKYTCKPEDFIIPDDWDLTTNLVRLLDSALAKRRFVAYGGLFREIHKKLNLDDEESGDLVAVDGETQEGSDLDPVVVFQWVTGYRQYISGID